MFVLVNWLSCDSSSSEGVAEKTAGELVRASDGPVALHPPTTNAPQMHNETMDRACSFNRMFILLVFFDDFNVTR